MRQIKINSTTGSELLTTQNVKDYVRIDTSADDSIISAMITQARIWCENFISRDIVAKNRTYYLDETNGLFSLPFGPVSSISSITIKGTATTDYEILGLDNETIELDGGPAQQVKITYVTSGQNDSLIKQAMLQLISTYYDNRSDFISGTISEIPTSTKTILLSYKSMFL
ncbi:MAG: putative head completion protein [Prokaryotic dsDNA virus sp.]|jgi:uncharacterized phiE125 gp8 family phage protein|nr:MAG: putative head completion protein [Prokaryotic dsDNA virus sp.]|tara:strand:+ start:6393 stop:6902 length:510 start_codon:yes stop_codon:yes gene_type:complete